jgi:hypothetical protein
MNSTSIENTILSTKQIVESDKNYTIRINANGGNSVLIVCNPNQELSYITAIKKLMPDAKYKIIDLNKLLCEFVNKNKSDLENSFELLRNSLYQIFKIPENEEGTDLLSLILSAIDKSLKADRIPVLINVGSLYGSRIACIDIIENSLVMKAKLPLIILYPATHDQDKLMFLGIRPSSKYRCMIIDWKS